MSGEVTVLTPTGMLGYGYREEDFESCVRAGVDAIVVDSGSTDPGPSMLGLGHTLVTEESYLRDLRPMVRAVHRHRIPLLIGSAGGAGTDEQVDRMVELLRRIAVEQGITLRVAAIYSQLPRSVVRERLAQGRIDPNVRGELPTESDVDSSEAVVAQIGAEPFETALSGPVDVVVAGRAYDPAPYAAFLVPRGIEPGIAWHIGKILECGGVCAEPKGGGALATARADSFDIEPMGPEQRCTPLSVAAHTLYENSRPDLLAGPGGVLDVGDCAYRQLDERTVRVSGSRFEPTPRRLVKVEGAAITGHRCIFIGGVHDPVLIGQLDDFLVRVEAETAELHPELAAGTATVRFHVYGRDAVMGQREPNPVPGHEVGILGEVVAETPEAAKAICTSARIGVLHLNYPGQLATAGNLALPLTPLDNPIGPVCAFSLYHLMEADGLEHAVVREEVGA
ncbi:acyclic terpene utilization AtuA family protein [Saccharopolyspora sp. NFXS83]|uniref:acyclic terpene utilization AtuA family protein n=1 Tax=Saccharopolyspora sp. NFXS83 TaxID=2993560 RepID=UPI00224AD81C|nr:acyclic terpene utilization AtuA family protein [Saccharopolyspora sp. NFXS83]MCX2730683.1 acyclic terpene utilization AtuA family protein [Saccharopolyspora sp. NFXS83]